MENLIQELNSIQKIHLCECCQEKKSLEDFYKYERRIDNKIISIEYLKPYCKNCLPFHFINFENFKNSRPIINFYQFRNILKQKEIEIFEKQHNVKMGELGTIGEFTHVFNLNKKTLKKRTILKLVKKYEFISTNPQNNHKEIKYLYNKHDLLNFYDMEEHGKFWHRTNKIISQGTKFIPDNKFLFRAENNQQFIYINYKLDSKHCIFCLQFKKLSEFPSNKNLIDKKNARCTDCCGIDTKIRYHNLTEEEKTEYRKRIKVYRQNNKKKVCQWKKQRQKKPENKIINKLRTRIRKVVNQLFGYKPELTYYGKTFFIEEVKGFGCSRKELKLYIESKFTDGMNWDNYGPGYKVDQNGKPIYDKNGQTIKIKQWCVDHIKPVSSFDLSNPEEIVKINHYTNLQPLWTNDNVIKGAKLNWSIKITN